MNIIRTFVPGSFANYNHLAYCPDTRETAAVDPFNAEHLLGIAKEHDLNITQIWLTHEHGDHIKDMAKLKAQTGATVKAPVSCMGKFEADEWLDDNQLVELGKTHCRHYLTPGHTPGHGVYIIDDKDKPENNAIVCGDTLFNGGVGNVKSGNVEELFQSVQRILIITPENASVYNGHDYIETNLNFVLKHFPTCLAAQKTMDLVSQQTPDSRSIQRLDQEREYNPFLSLNAEWLLTDQSFAKLSEKERFIELRHRRDQW